MFFVAGGGGGGTLQVLTDLALVSAPRAAQALSELEAKLKGEPSVVRNVSAYFTGKFTLMIIKSHLKMQTNSSGLAAIEWQE